MLDVHDVLAAAADGRVYQQWADQDDLVVGFASVQELTLEAAVFFYRFFGTRNVEQGIGTLRVAISRSKGGTYWNRPSFVCPQCGRTVVRLYYVRGSWACKKSHDLLTITQRLDQINKAIYVKEVHERRLAERESGRIEQRKIDKHKPKYGAAISLLSGSLRTQLPANLQFRCFGRWLEKGELPREEPHRDEVGYGWQAGDNGQLADLAPARKPPRRPASKAEPAKRPAAPSPAPQALPSWLSPGARAPGYVDPMEEIMKNLDLSTPPGLLWPEDE